MVNYETFSNHYNQYNMSKEIIIQILNDEYNINIANISTSTHLKHLGLDSLDIAEAIIIINDKLSIDLKIEEFDFNTETIQTLIDKCNLLVNNI